MITIAVDCMGGDHGPEVTLPACSRFLDQHPDVQLILVGLPQSMAGFAHARATVVLASEGYPESSAPSRVIRGLRKAVLGQSSKVEICHAATVQKNNSAGKLEFLSTGGRVLTIVAVGKTFAKARKRAYRAISRIKLEGSHFRSDIAAKVSE